MTISQQNVLTVALKAVYLNLKRKTMLILYNRLNLG